MRVVTIDGVTKYMLGNAILVRDAHGIPAHVVGTALDISDQVAADAERARLESQIQQAQKLESLGVLAGGIAHDFNNLLVGILGNASLALLELDETHHARESIASIERAAQRAAELTRQLLAYAGKGRFVVEPIDVSAAVKEMSSLLRTAVSRTASMQLDLAKQLPAIEVDTTQFRQVLMNLITNASDALRDDAGMISLRTGVRHVDRDFLATCIVGSNATPGHYVFVEVQDSGIGMDEATMARIFDPFFSTKFTGRGLGLAATLGIVRSHHGAIHVHSVVGEGTSFTVLFPVSDRSAQVHVTPRASSWHGRGEILVIDDEPSVLAITATLLTRRGFAVTKANDGAQGIELYGADPSRFALVLLDMTMPGLDGQTVLRALRALDRDVRVLLMSGYNEQEVNQMFAGPGPAGFLQKPFRADELYEVVARTLELHDDWPDTPPAASTTV
jgi:signal transduction histidine kinase/ActR/RegA family two-component response regulator